MPSPESARSAAGRHRVMRRSVPPRPYPPGVDSTPAAGRPSGPAARRLAVRTTPDALRQVRGGHPWVYDKSIVSVSPEGSPGDLAVIFDDQRRFAAIGLWDPTSPVRIRVLHSGRPRQIDGAFWRERLRTALERRTPLIARGDTSGYRVVHGENDGLPGLVLDRYERVVVLKAYSAAWMPHLADVVSAVDELLHPESVVLRLARSIPEPHLHGFADGDALLGTHPDGPVPFTELGLWFEADVVAGQKTGHFLDQRDNRALVASLAGGRRVLDVFASTGGFTVHAAAGGAAEIVSVDLSAPTLAVAERNLARNRHLPAVASCVQRSVAGDAFAVLRQFRADREQFDIVVVDPPSFASRASQVEGALRAYSTLTSLALDVLRPGGILVQCSCTARVDAGQLERSMLRAADAAGRQMRITARTGHPLDHPVGFAEGAYLKAVIARMG